MMRLFTLVAVIGLSIWSLPPAFGKTDSDTLTKKEAVELALKEYSGKTLKITDQGSYYIIRILGSNGRVLDVQVDKKTGAVRKD
ncbi:PepSY domain-containing protein [Pseudoalteromonas xiamenensis]|jgi:uncharacterized membrane protein YkoI|nr:PepSY domain-containing protein [Pseudoalteromonas xiamenensis]WMN59832.1 PepSY domain-containing protein [Pseudoalteromonas xiamenensis]